jgi:proline dehydrogenase
MLAASTRLVFSLLAGSSLLKKAASAWGLRHRRSPARRFVAGEQIADALAAARALEQQGLETTLDLLGESVSSTDKALAAAQAYVSLITEAHAAGLRPGVSVKLTQIGLDVDRATAIDNLRRILEAGRELECFVRVDMEGSAYTDDTLETVTTLWSIGYRHLGVALQAALRRTPTDLERLIGLGISIRLVKGAYREPRSVAFVKPEEVDAQFVTLMERLLVSGTHPAIATHDPALIERTRTFAAARGLAPESFDFELLYGIRRDLQLRLLQQGHRVRIYVPYGGEWFPYFMRRLGERPANIAFVLRSLFAEERAP